MDSRLCQNLDFWAIEHHLDFEPSLSICQVSLQTLHEAQILRPFFIRKRLLQPCCPGCHDQMWPRRKVWTSPLKAASKLWKNCASSRDFPSFQTLGNFSVKDLKILPSLKLTYHLKMDGWKTTFLLRGPILRGYVSFREGKSSQRDHPNTPQKLTTAHANESHKWRPEQPGDCWGFWGLI